MTATSGPGVDLKSEGLGLAISLELPLLLVDVQRGGPSTGLPTKTEQADLLLAMYGRHGEAPLPIVAARSPSHCFDAAIEAVRIALKYRTPVILLTDGYIANGAEPWLLPDVDSLPDLSVQFATEPNHDGVFWPYLRDPETLARPWAIPGTPGLMHRIGGIEKQDGTGNVNYDPENHEHMVHLRADKVARIAADIPGIEVDDPDGAGNNGSGTPADLLVLGWGSTWGVAQQAVRQARAAGKRVAHAHLVHLNPFPANLGEVLARYPKVLVPEMNLGQLSRLVRAEYLVDAAQRHEGAGPALPGVRDRARDHGDDLTMSDDNGGTGGTAVALGRKDFQSDQEVRWCPGCGDYSILAAMQLYLAEAGVRPENLVFISGIGCAARFPYYMNVYGLHSIHGRARRSQPAWRSPGPTSTSG